MKTRVASEPLAELLDRHTIEGDPFLCRSEGDRIRCLACGHRCLVGDGLRGICKVRFNRGGRLRVPFGYVAGVQCDPVEKKPFFHVYPGSDALTFGMLGCDLHCSYCQNWLTSQALRDSRAVAPPRPVTAEELIDHARREGARLVVSSYNEPLITAEWAVAVFRQAAEAGLACAFVSNGNATPEVLDFLQPWIVAYKVDLKSFHEQRYRTLGGTLENVTDTIRRIRQRGIWLEVVTLIVPGFNDDPEELRRAAAFLASVSPDIPWHVTAFHRDYRMTEPDPTSADKLVQAAEIGTAEGLRFVYAGNLPGQVGPWEDTRCPQCRQTVIRRYGFLIRSFEVTPDGHCPHCAAAIPGTWPRSAAEVRTGNTVEAYRGRLPRRVAVPAEETLALPGSGETTVSPPASPAAAKPQPSTPGRPNLSEGQKQQLLDAAAAMLRAAVLEQPFAFPDELAYLRDQPVAGVFSSLKRGRHLRACCGVMGQTVPLGHALEKATYRTAWEDVRFPPVSPTELDHLDLELWLLFAPQMVQAQGEERLAAITLGRHGIQVARGQSHGLFLPSVPVENRWDTRRYLDQVCIKAGLPASAWKEDDTALSIFEGEAIRGRVAGGEDPAFAGRCRAVCQPQEVVEYAEFCKRELANLLQGATPSYYFWGAPDGTVNGVLLALRPPGNGGGMTLSQISLRPGIPLQATLFSLIRTAAQSLAAQRVSAAAIESLQVEVAFLHDPALHGTVDDPHLDGLHPDHRAVVVLDRNHTGLVFEPGRSAAELLQEASTQARVRQPATATIVSLDTLASAVPLRVSTAPQPVRGPAVRPAAVAGTFYEADPAALARTVDQLLEGDRCPEPWAAALVPHAGLRFSGRLAGDVLRRLHIPSTVIVIGPKHTPHGMDWAVAPHQTWEIPGATVESDWLLARKLSQAIPGLEMDAAAHQREHAIEVELPLLARLAPQSKVVGIAIGHGDLDSCRRFAEGLAGVLRQREDRPLLLISSDMNHFASDAENRQLDALALAELERCDPARLFETVTQHNISMCGVLPAVIVLETLKILNGGSQAERVGYATSADVTGDTARVVGYAGMLFR